MLDSQISKKYGSKFELGHPLLPPLHSFWVKFKNRIYRHRLKCLTRIILPKRIFVEFRTILLDPLA
jgi:hypothetical protein